MTSPDRARDAWTRTLDECEARLDAAAQTLDAGRTLDAEGRADLTPFPGSGPAEPFPTELVDRALALVKRSSELERRLGDERNHVRSELHRLPRMPRTHSTSHLDVKA